jgi:hypothetical protein
MNMFQRTLSTVSSPNPHLRGELSSLLSSFDFCNQFHKEPQKVLNQAMEIHLTDERVF